jgi:hypothetical protein
MPIDYPNSGNGNLVVGSEAGRSDLVSLLHCMGSFVFVDVFGEDRLRELNTIKRTWSPALSGQAE